MATKITDIDTSLINYGGWLPRSRSVQDAFIAGLLEKVRGRRAGQSPIFSGGIPLPAERCKAVSDFENAIRASPTMLDLFNKTFDQASDENKIKDFDDLLDVMDIIVQAAPEFQVVPGQESEPIGVPLYLVLDLLSNTDAAHILFRMPEFNRAMKDLLDSWGTYLKDGKSNYTLNDGPTGWFGEAGIKSLEDKGRGVFNQTYEVRDQAAVNRGYKSWDDFFTREVLPEARPVQKTAYPHVNDQIVNNACESTGYRVARGIKENDQFWLKSQAYSLKDMLKTGNAEEDESFVKQFIGGTVYQAFLSPQDYHRWRSPVDGEIVKAVVVPGTYYAVVPDEIPRGALVRSQSWLTIAATRALIFIKTKRPDIGLLCFIGMGMCEVSTCDLSVQAGKQVKAGDELGMFHFGGSTHALLFGPNVKVEFKKEDDKMINEHFQVNSILGQAVYIPKN